MITAITGMDGSGKSTLSNILYNDLSAKYVHFSNPKDMADGKEQYFNFLDRIKNDNSLYICDRFHDGEWVYAPIYRGYIADYQKEIESEILKNHNYLLVYVTASFDTILKRIDIRGEDFVKREHFQLVMDNYVNNFVMEQKLPFVIVDTTTVPVEESIRKIKEDIVKVDTIYNKIRECTSSRCDGVVHPTPFPRGNARAKYMIVGQNPGGRGLDKEKRIYTAFDDGRTPLFLIDVLKKAGIYLDCWFTNVVLCSTKDNKINNDQSNTCNNNLKLQIEMIKPEKIFALGKVAADYINNNYKNVEVIEVPHPTYVKRFFSNKPDKIEEYINMFRV